MRLGGRPADAYLYPIPLRQALPKIPIPLRRDDPLVTLDLQPLIEGAYEKRRYGRTLDYTRPPSPPLDGEDAAWAHELLVRAGKRPEKAT